MKSYNLKFWLFLFIMWWRIKDKGKSFGLSSLVGVLRANLMGSNKMTLLKESSRISLSENMEVSSSVVHIPLS